jgi:nitroreductase
MDLYEAIRKRFSVRSYRDDPVADDKLARILGAARDAPTARNRQQWRLVVVRDAGTRRALAEAADQPFLAEAPLVLAIVGLTPKETMHCQVPTDPVDCAIVLEHVALAAAAEDLGTCWIGHFDQQAACQALGVPDSARIIELMPLGCPAATQPARRRKAIDALVCEDRFA